MRLPQLPMGKRKGGRIRVEATDNVLVTRVLVMIWMSRGRCWSREKFCRWTLGGGGGSMLPIPSARLWRRPGIWLAIGASWF